MLTITCHTPLTSLTAPLEPSPEWVTDFPDCVRDVAQAIVQGAILITRRHSVGRYRMATDRDQVRFACLDRRGAVMPVDEVEPHATSLYTQYETRRHDWSAYGAALAFVEVEGTASARRALQKAARAARKG